MKCENCGKPMSVNWGLRLCPSCCRNSSTTDPTNKDLTYQTICSIKGCNLPAGSISPLHIPFCINHQIKIIQAIEEKLNHE